MSEKHNFLSDSATALSAPLGDSSEEIVHFNIEGLGYDNEATSEFHSLIFRKLTGRMSNKREAECYIFLQ